MIIKFSSSLVTTQILFVTLFHGLIRLGKDSFLKDASWSKGSVLYRLASNIEDTTI